MPVKDNDLPESESISNSMTQSPRFEIEPKEISEPRPRRGCLIMTLTGCTLAGIVCAGICAGVGWWSWQYFRSSFILDADSIVVLSESIVTIDLPEGMKPKLGIDLQNPFSGKSFTTWVIFESSEEDMVIVLSQFDGSVLDERDRDRVRVEIRRALDDEDVTPEKVMVERDANAKPIISEVHGKPASFMINRATGEDSGRELWAVLGSFEGLSGPCMFMMQADREKYEELTIRRVIESIR